MHMGVHACTCIHIHVYTRVYTQAQRHTPVCAHTHSHTLLILHRESFSSSPRAQGPGYSWPIFSLFSAGFDSSLTSPAKLHAGPPLPGRQTGLGKEVVFPEVEVLLHKTLDGTGLLQRHFILTAERKQSLLKKQLLILSIPE